MKLEVYFATSNEIVTSIDIRDIKYAHGSRTVYVYVYTYSTFYLVENLYDFTPKKNR